MTGRGHGTFAPSVPARVPIPPLTATASPTGAAAVTTATAAPAQEGVVQMDNLREQEKTEEPKQEDELDSYSKGVQSRIKKLTEKYRQEERDKSEAVRLSQELIEENKKLKTRVQALDTGYLSEYG